MAPVLGYWTIRGLAQPIKLLLKYNKVEFEEKHYTVGEGDDRSCWYDVKFKLGLDFPNLPYYFDGDVKISQSNAILRHIARKHNMCGKTEKERVLVDILESQLTDFKWKFYYLTYDAKNYEANKPAFLENVKAPIKAFADFLGDKKFLVGDELTFVDFVLYEALDNFLVFEASLFEPHKNLKDYHARIEALPAIAAYMKSDDFIEWPINNSIAAWGVHR